MENKIFFINIEKKWSEEAIKVQAKNIREAKKKGWEKFKKRVCERKDYTIYADKI